MQAQYQIIIVQAITGGLESPIQLIWQLWLIFNGHIDLNLSQISSVSDLQGNTLYLPFTPAMCILFSIMSILSAILQFNVSRIHIILRSWVDFWKSIPVYFDFLPFFASGAIFRISSVIAIFTYFTTFGILPVVAMLISSMVINLINFRGEMDHIPSWLIMCMSLFVPVCFSTSQTSSQKLIEIQMKTFFYQALMNFIIYGGTLIALLVYVNGESETLNLEMNAEIILNNQQGYLALQQI